MVDENDNTEDGGDVILQMEDRNARGDNDMGNDGEDAKDVEGEEENNHLEKKRRKKSSKVHVDFIEVTQDGVAKLQCIHCKTLLKRLLQGQQAIS